MNKFRLDGVVGVDFDAAFVAEKLGDSGDVEITLNSPGGDVIEGMAIYSAILEHKGSVSIVIDQAMSMASVFMLAADRRVARRESSLIMIHRPWGMGVGNADEMRASADVLDKMQKQMVGIYMGAMKTTEQELSAMLDDETYLDADEALALGLVTEVVSGSRSALHKMAFASLARDNSEFNKTKFAAKVKQIEGKNSDFCANLQKAGKLSEIESAIRQRFSASRAEATAIVSSVKRIQSDSVSVVAEDSAAKALDILKSFKL